MRRVNITLTDTEYADLVEYCKKTHPHIRVTTAVKKIALLSVTNSNESLRIVTTPTPSPSLVADTPPDPAHAPVRIKEKKNKKEEEEKRGSHEGEKPIPPSKPSRPGARLAPVDVVTRILSDLNDRAGTSYRASGKRVRELIAARLAEGHTEADFLEVHRKKCREWLGSDMERYLTYETLYRARKFGQYLGQPDVGPRQPLPTTEAEKRAARYARRKQPGYYDTAN